MEFRVKCSLGQSTKIIWFVYQLNKPFSSVKISFFLNVQVEVRTADHSRTTIRKTDVETLNIDNNLLDGLEFKKFVSQFPNLQAMSCIFISNISIQDDAFRKILRPANI